MYKIKTFKNKNDYINFINKNKDKITYNNIFINNVLYAIEYKKKI